MTRTYSTTDDALAAKTLAQHASRAGPWPGRRHEVVRARIDNDSPETQERPVAWCRGEPRGSGLALRPTP